jgi:NAD-dependent SIR2 family protein deacetylase
MTSLQGFLLAVVPRKLGQAIEKESRLWTLRCQTCDSETSIWDAGGIRYLASGRPKRLHRCPKCNTLTWHAVYKKD